MACGRLTALLSFGAPWKADWVSETPRRAFPTVTMRGIHKRTIGRVEVRLRDLAVRLALAMGEVVQRAGPAFFRLCEMFLSASVPRLFCYALSLEQETHATCAPQLGAVIS